MKIKILPRTYFAERVGTAEEIDLLRTHKIISLNSSSGQSAMPPFSDLQNENLLCLTVDDIVFKIRGMVLFNREQAVQIWNFVENSKKPFLIHCQAGISRSGAVGEVLNWYFNAYRDDDEYEAFYREHPQIIPNVHIRELLLQTLDQRLKLHCGSCFNLMEKELKKIRKS